MRRYQAEFRILAPEGAENVHVFKNTVLMTDNLLCEAPDLEVRISGDRLMLSCNAQGKGAAYEWALSTASRFARLISMKTGQHFTPVFNGLDSVPGEAGHSILSPLPLRVWVDAYDRSRFADDVAASGLVCSLSDRLLDRALEYFHRGLFYRRIVWRLIYPLSPDGIFTASEATLNFYKAVAGILGDDPHGPRSQALQLDRELRRWIKHLYKRRTDRDVAHPTMGVDALDELRSTIAGSQDIARRVIEAYVGFLREGRNLSGMVSAKRPRPRKRL